MNIDFQRILRLALTLVVVTAATAATWKLARVDWDLEYQERPGEDAGPTDLLRSRELLGDRPLDGGAFRTLGDMWATSGDEAVAAGFYRTAARREPRDPRVRVSLINLYLAGGNATAAAYHLDALLRISPVIGNPLLRRVLDSNSNAALRNALASRLALDPPWRELLPTVLAATSDVTSAEKLLTLLGKRSSLRPAEVAVHASLLEQMDRPADARHAWAIALPAELQALDGLIFDGGFEAGEGPEPYGWRLRSPVGAVVGVDTSQQGHGRGSLVLLFDGRVVEFSGVSQDIVLEPDTYQLSLVADVALGEGSRPFAWTVACRSNDVRIGHLEVPNRTDGWKEFSTQFEIPPSCPTQRLELVHEGRSLSERRLQGRMAFGSIEVHGCTGGSAGCQQAHRPQPRAAAVNKPR